MIRDSRLKTKLETRNADPEPSETVMDALQKRVIACKTCPRLVEWRTTIAEKRTRRFAEWKYWGKPVPSFGDTNARLLLVGLAPAAHGGNRTGRMFTGDESGNWLFRALFNAGFSTQPTSTDRSDGLKLYDCYITATCRCAPPKNKLLRDEIRNCRPFLLKELSLLKNIRVVIGVGKIGFDAAFDSFRKLCRTQLKSRPKFGHGVIYKLNENVTLIGTYHPSQQNTFTGKLTENMLNEIFTKARKMLDRHADAKTKKGSLE